MPRLEVQLSVRLFVGNLPPRLCFPELEDLFTPFGTLLSAELMTDRKEGFVLSDPADVATLAGRMQELLEPAQREKMGAAGRALAMQHTFEEQTTQFLELYREIISTKHSGPFASK